MDAKEQSMVQWFYIILNSMGIYTYTYTTTFTVKSGKKDNNKYVLTEAHTHFNSSTKVRVSIKRGKHSQCF